MLFLLSLLSIAEAEPLKGLRLNACVSNISSHCPIVQLGLAYNTKRFAVDVGYWQGFSVPVGLPIAAHAGLQVYPSDNDKNRWFVGASVGGGFVVIATIGAIGGYVGRDFHLLSSKKLIITPRIGYDFGGSSSFDGPYGGSSTDEYSFMSFSLETAYAF